MYKEDVSAVRKTIKMTRNAELLYYTEFVNNERLHLIPLLSVSHLRPSKENSDFLCSSICSLEFAAKPEVNISGV